MSYAMGYYTIIRVEASIPIDNFMFDVVLVHIGGWTGDIRHNYDELQIIKCFKFSDEQIESLKEKNSYADSIKHIGQYLGVDRLEKGDYDSANIVDLDQYKKAIKKFRNLAVFI